MYEGWSSLQDQQVKNLMVHCCGAGSLSDPGISMCCRCGPKKKKEPTRTFFGCHRRGCCWQSVVEARNAKCATAYRIVLDIERSPSHSADKV